MLDNRFFLLGWDIEVDDYHSALIQALNKRNEFALVTDFVNKKTCAALLVVPVGQSITLFSCMRDKVSDKDFLDTFKKAEEFLIVENAIEKDLYAETDHSRIDMGYC